MPDVVNFVDIIEIAMTLIKAGNEDSMKVKEIGKKLSK